MPARRLYAVNLDDKCEAEVREKVYERLKDRFDFGYVYRHGDSLILVATSPGAMAHDVAEAAGLRGKNREAGATGVVFKLNRGYSGFTSKVLWEWMSDMRDDE